MLSSAFHYEIAVVAHADAFALADEVCASAPKEIDSISASATTTIKENKMKYSSSLD